jgi:hypothetical protein
VCYILPFLPNINCVSSSCMGYELFFTLFFVNFLCYKHALRRKTYNITFFKRCTISKGKHVSTGNEHWPCTFYAYFLGTHVHLITTWFATARSTIANSKFIFAGHGMFLIKGFFINSKVKTHTKMIEAKEITTTLHN